MSWSPSNDVLSSRPNPSPPERGLKFRWKPLQKDSKPDNCELPGGSSGLSLVLANACAARATRREALIADAREPARRPDADTAHSPPGRSRILPYGVVVSTTDGCCRAPSREL